MEQTIREIVQSAVIMYDDPYRETCDFTDEENLVEKFEMDLMDKVELLVYLEERLANAGYTTILSDDFIDMYPSVDAMTDYLTEELSPVMSN